MLRPKLFDTFKAYDRKQLLRDLMAGITVGLVALPLSIAFAIASGVAPEKGIYTAIIGGFIISAMGGSRVQIGGPTGAFIIIVSGIVQQYGMGGLVTATFLAGIILVIMGFSKVGSIMKFVPYPLIVGFTSGIALIIFSTEVKDLLGLHINDMPTEFLGKWGSYFHHFNGVSPGAAVIGIMTIVIIFLWPKITYRIPGSLIAIVFATLVIHLLRIPQDTIESRFGGIAASLPKPALPTIDFSILRNLIEPAFTIALLGGIESLLSAVVADGMIGGQHRSNMELIAQGIANIVVPFFGGIPSTGAIARTATNIKNGGRTPVAGIIHSVTLLLLLIFFGKWAAMVPMAALAGVLMTVAYNMSEWENFVVILKGKREDAAILLVTFVLTVLIGLMTAIGIGMVLAAFAFIRQMIKQTDVYTLADDRDEHSEVLLPKILSGEVDVFEISGPLFFGAVYKFREAINSIDKPAKILIIRMGKVSMIDATGIMVIKEICKQSHRRGTKLLLTEIPEGKIAKYMENAGLPAQIGQANMTTTMHLALQRCMTILNSEG